MQNQTSLSRFRQTPAEKLKLKGSGEKPAGESVEELRRKVKSLGRRELQLWGSALVVLWLMTAGYILPIVTTLLENLGAFRLPSWDLLQLATGLVAVMVLFSCHVLHLRRTLNRAREMILEQLVRRESAEHESILDPLTRVFNRRYLDQILQREIRRANRHGAQISFLMIDLDNFKLINTRFGHLAGDNFLYEAAQLLQKSFRMTDTVIRYGGDEFLVVLADSTSADAERAQARLKEDLARWNLAHAQEEMAMSMSCGMASYVPGADVIEVLAEADRDMYRQKARSGVPSEPVEQPTRPGS